MKFEMAQRIAREDAPLFSAPPEEPTTGDLFASVAEEDA